MKNCRLENNARRGLALARSSVRFEDTVITGNGTGATIIGTKSVFRCENCFIGGLLFGGGQSVLDLIDSELVGSFRVNSNTRLILDNIDQTDNPDGNQLNGDSQLHVFGGSTILGETQFRTFSTGLFRENTTHDGDLFCNRGSDVVCRPTTDIIGGGTSNCSSCFLARVDCDADDSLQAAVDIAVEGAELFVSGNCDDGPFVITRDIKLTGPATLSAPAGSFAVLFIDTSRVELRNLTIDDGGYQRGILLQGSRAKMTNVYVEGATFFGIEVQGISSATISDSEVSYNQSGVLVERSSSVDISNNTTVENNTIFGMIIKSSSTASIFGGNVFSGNQQGVTVEGNSSIRMGNSTVSNNTFSGVRLQYSSYVDIVDSANTIQDNDFADVVCETGGIIRTSPQISSTAVDFIDVSCIVEGSIF